MDQRDEGRKCSNYYRDKCKLYNCQSIKVFIAQSDTKAGGTESARVRGAGWGGLIKGSAERGERRK